MDWLPSAAIESRDTVPVLPRVRWPQGSAGQALARRLEQAGNIERTVHGQGTAGTSPLQPHVALHDRDALAEAEPIDSERALNDLIADVVGDEHTVVLGPDFEGVSGLRGRSHKPERAWRRFTSLSGPELPEPLARAAELALGLARGGGLGEPD